MKFIKLFFSIFLLLTIFSCNENTSKNDKNTEIKSSVLSIENTETEKNNSKKYTIKSASIDYKQSMNGVESKNILHFDDNGNTSVNIIKSSVNILGKIQVTEMKTYTIDGFIYSFSTNTKNGTKAKVSTIPDFYHFNHDTLSDEQKQMVNFKEEGKEDIAGKTCNVYSMNYENAFSKYWIWENIVLKFDVKDAQMQISLEATNVNDKPDFESKFFEVPKDIKFTSFEDMMGNMDTQMEKAMKQ